MSETSANAAEVVNDAIYHLTQSDVDSVYTFMSGMVTIQMFTLLAQLLMLGVLLMVVFVIAVRRF